MHLKSYLLKDYSTSRNTRCKTNAMQYIVNWVEFNFSKSFLFFKYFFRCRNLGMVWCERAVEENLRARFAANHLRLVSRFRGPKFGRQERCSNFNFLCRNRLRVENCQFGVRSQEHWHTWIYQRCPEQVCGLKYDFQSYNSNLNDMIFIQIW